MAAGPGAHRIVGRGGTDRLCGGPGDDYLHGGKGRDHLRGGENDDVLIGGPGRDILNAGPGADTVNSRDGNADRINCGPGNDKARVDLHDTVVACERVALPEAPEPESTTPDFALPNWADGLWDAPDKYRTIQLADIDGDGDDELLGRSAQGLEVHTFDVESGQWMDLDDGAGIDLADDQGYDQPFYYSVIQAADLAGGAAEELLVRTQAGMQVWSFDPGAKSWVLLTQGLGMMDNAGQWTFPKYYSTIQTADVNGDGHADLLGRGELGMVTATLVPDSSTPQLNDYLWQALGSGPSPFRNDQGWDQPQYYETIQTADLNGDGAYELLGRAQDGLTAFEWSGGWKALPLTNTIFSSGGVDKSWDQPKYYETIASGHSPALQEATTRSGATGRTASGPSGTTTTVTPGRSSVARSTPPLGGSPNTAPRFRPPTSRVTEWTRSSVGPRTAWAPGGTTAG